VNICIGCESRRFGLVGGFGFCVDDGLLTTVMKHGWDVMPQNENHAGYAENIRIDAYDSSSQHIEDQRTVPLLHGVSNRCIHALVAQSTR
jgi:hypothetical protein